MAIETALSINRGEERIYQFSQTPPSSIVGWTLAFTVAKAKNSPSKIMTLVPTITDGPNGVYNVSVDASDTINVKPGVYYWDVWRTDAEAEVLLGYGTFTVHGVARLPTT